MKAIRFLRQALSRPWLAAIFLFALAANAAETNSPFHSLPPFVLPKYSIAILSFENKAGQTNWQHWDSSLSGFLSAAIGQVSSIFVFGNDARGFAYRQLKISPGDKIDPDQARKVGEVIHAQHVVWGNYNRRDEKWLVKLRVISTSTGKISREMSAESADWYDVRDQLAGQILQELTIAPSATERKKMLRRPTHSSAALELYSVSYAIQRNAPLPEQEKIARQVIALDPQFPQAHLGLASTLFTVGRPDEAEEPARRAAKLMPDLAGAHATLGTIFMAQWKIADAEKELIEAVRLDPYDTEYLDRLAEFYLMQQRDSEAAAIWDWLEQLDPALPTVHAELGHVYALKGDLKKARAELQEAERLQIDDVNTEQQLCNAYKTLHDSPKALEHLDKFLRLAQKLKVSPDWIKSFAETRQDIQRASVATFVEASEPKTFTPQTLDAELRQRLSPDEIKLAVNPLLSTPEMKRWAEEQTRGATNDFDKAKKLFDALAHRVNSGPGGLRTAPQVFADWKNPDAAFRCQEFALFYVALARQIGLQAYVVDVERDYDDKSVLHVCAGVFLNGQALLIDPTCLWFGVPHKKINFVNDLQITAIYLAQLENQACTRIALKLQPDLTLAQFNLFLDLCRGNKLEEAEVELEKALAMDSKSAQSFRARGYFEARRQHWQLAAYYLRKSMEVGPMPHTQFLLAETLREQHRWNDALEQYRAYLENWPRGDEAADARAAVLEISEHVHEK